MSKNNCYQQYYEENKGYEVGLYAYSPPSSGYMNLDGARYYIGQDFRTPEQYQIYKDCGFNALLGQVENHYTGEEWETSVAKKNMDMVYNVGVKKFILLDERIFELSRTKGGVIGEGKRFKNEGELDAFIIECMKPYKDHPCFYGLQLLDEPRLPFLEPIGQVYRAIKRVRKETFVQCNLMPPFFLFNPGGFLPQDGDFWTRYRNYLKAFLDATGADYFMYDFYPLISSESEGVYNLYFRGLQESAKVAKERNVNFYMVLQSMVYKINCSSDFRTLGKSDMYWQVNAALGFGINQMAYFTYWAKGDNNIYGEYFPNEKAIITRDGKKTPLYDYVKEVNEMIQKLAPVLKDFKYTADAHNAHWPCTSKPMFLREMICLPLKHVKLFRPDREVALVNELYDEKHDRYMYRIMNCTDTYYGKDTGEQVTEVEFDKKFTKADVFKDGEWKTVELIDGKYTAKLEPGYADYIILY